MNVYLCLINPIFMFRQVTLLTSLTIVLIAVSLVFLPEKSESETQKIPNEWFYRQRAFPFGEINQQAYNSALKQAKEMREISNSQRDESSWEFAGPLNIGGRISDVEMHPSDLNTIYLGAAAGGVFKSDDKGATWYPIFDEALSLSIGDIAIAPSNPDVIYVGTGEANAGGGSLAYDGVGIYKSTDAGENWDYIGLEESRNVGRMVVDPQNPEVLYVAAMGSLFANGQNRGVFKTSNGGETWEQSLFVSDSTGAIDIAIHPTNSDTLYAAMWERVRRPNRRSYGGPTCGLYRSFDGGEIWTEMTNGLPTLAQDKGRIGIDISVSNPNILYAIYADEIGYFNGVFKSANNGDSWTRTNDNSLSNSFASYGWWFGRIKVDPVDPDNVFVIGFDIYRSLTGGNNWTNQSYNVHVDQHAVYIHPMDNDFVVLGNDGGLYLSENGGTSWQRNVTLPITQFYTCEMDYQQPWRLYGGAQDNGTNRIINDADGDWENIYGGDGFYVLVDPENNNYIYAEYQNGGLGRSTNGGVSFSNATSGISGSDRFNWNCPVVFDPANPEILFFGSNRLYKTTNRAVSWNAISSDLTDGNQPGNLAYNTLTTISVSPVNSQVIYTGADDGNVHVSTDGGVTYQNISEGLPKRWITRVTADPVEASVVYVTISGYRWDEFMPHIFRSDDFGQTWTDISANLPEAPVNDIIINYPNNQTLFAATDVGVYVSYDQGLSWSVMGNNLPNVVVNDLVLHKPTNSLVAATYGRSMYRYDLEQDPLTKVHENDLRVEISAYPNPFSQTIALSVNMELPYQVTISDLSGKLIKSFTASAKTVKWDGKNKNGRMCVKGVYFITIESTNKTLTKKIIMK